MYLKIEKKWRFSVDVIMIILGTLIMGFSFSIFLEPNNISTGGFSGLSMIINSVFCNIGINFLSSSIIYLALNVLLFFIALKALGKKYAIKAIIGICSFSLSMELFALLPITLSYEPLISAVYGGTIMGIGVGLVVRFGGSTGGSDMVASIVRTKYNKFSIGSIIVMVDAVVILLTLIVYSNGFEILPYTIIALALDIFLTDFVNEGYKQVKAYYIITDKPDVVANKIMDKLGHGCTATNVIGMHSGSNRTILTCVIHKFQSEHLKKIVQSLDSEAFVFSTNVHEVIGSWAKNVEIDNDRDDNRIVNANNNDQTKNNNSTQTITKDSE